MLSAVFSVALVAGILGGVPVLLALLVARDRESARRWPAGWLVRRRVVRPEREAFRSMRIESAEPRRYVRAGMPPLLAAVAGLVAMMAFVWLVAFALSGVEFFRAALHGEVAWPLLRSTPFCLLRSASGFWLAGAVFQREARGAARAAAAAGALEVVALSTGLRISDSTHADRVAELIGLALTAAVLAIFAASERRRRGLVEAQQGSAAGAAR